MNKVLLTGGAGFIGSHVADSIINHWPSINLTILDKMTYAADENNLEHVLSHKTVRLVKGDMCDFGICKELTAGIDLVLNLAAESHVDNSFGNSLNFTRSNVFGTHSLIEACRINQVPRIIHVSTDEVYGDILNGSFDETAILNPTNPYSASKAAAEMMVNSYIHSFNLPVITVRANNIYGIRQFPEKIIPKFCMQVITDNKMTLHGNGKNIRTYLSVKDFADALILLIEKGKLNQIYNVGTNEEYTNLEIASIISKFFGKNFVDCVQFIEDRPFNDKRYSVNCDNIKSLGWEPARKLFQEINGILSWYEKNQDRYSHLFSTHTHKANVVKETCQVFI